MYIYIYVHSRYVHVPASRDPIIYSTFKDYFSAVPGWRPRARRSGCSTMNSGCFLQSKMGAFGSSPSREWWFQIQTLTFTKLTKLTKLGLFCQPFFRGLFIQEWFMGMWFHPWSGFWRIYHQKLKSQESRNFTRPAPTSANLLRINVLLGCQLLSFTFLQTPGNTHDWKYLEMRYRGSRPSQITVYRPF